MHAVLVDQCRAMGRALPYLIHRHETAVVSMEEHQQVTQMVAWSCAAAAWRWATNRKSRGIKS
jgi:hypothetical protein